MLGKHFPHPIEQSVVVQVMPLVELELLETLTPLVVAEVEDEVDPPIPPPELVLVGDPLEVELDDPPVLRSNTYPDRHAIGVAAVSAKSTAVPNAVREYERQADIRTSPRG